MGPSRDTPRWIKRNLGIGFDRVLRTTCSGLLKNEPLVRIIDATRSNLLDTKPKVVRLIARENAVSSTRNILNCGQMSADGA